MLDWTYRAVFTVSRLFGVFPILFHTGRDIRLSKLGLLNTAAMLVLSFASFAGTVRYNGRLSSYILFTEVISLNISILMSTVWLLVRRQKLSEALNAVLEVQVHHGQRLASITSALQLFLGLLLIFLIFTIRLASVYDGTSYTVFEKIFYYLPYIMIYTMVVQFVSMVTLVGESFSLLGEALASSPFPPSDHTAFLNMHLKLMTAASSINAFYGPQNLFIITSGFVNFTSSVYTIILEKPHTSIVLLVFSVFFFPIVCFSIASACNQTKYKAKMFTNVLYEQALESKSSNLADNVKLCFHFLYTKDIIFTASDFLVLDYPLLCSMAAAATSYLLILVQFSLMEASSHSQSYNASN